MLENVKYLKFMKDVKTKQHMSKRVLKNKTLCQVSLLKGAPQGNRKHKQVFSLSLNVPASSC